MLLVSLRRRCPRPPSPQTFPPPALQRPTGWQRMPTTRRRRSTRSRISTAISRRSCAARCFATAPEDWSEQVRRIRTYSMVTAWCTRSPSATAASMCGTPSSGRPSTRRRRRRGESYGATRLARSPGAAGVPTWATSCRRTWLTQTSSSSAASCSACGRPRSRTGSSRRRCARSAWRPSMAPFSQACSSRR